MASMKEKKGKKQRRKELDWKEEESNMRHVTSSSTVLTIQVDFCVSLGHKESKVKVWIKKKKKERRRKSHIESSTDANIKSKERKKERKSNQDLQ